MIQCDALPPFPFSGYFEPSPSQLYSCHSFMFLSPIIRVIDLYHSQSIIYIVFYLLASYIYTL